VLTDELIARLPRAAEVSPNSRERRATNKWQLGPRKRSGTVADLVRASGRRASLGPRRCWRPGHGPRRVVVGRAGTAGGADGTASSAAWGPGRASLGAAFAPTAADRFGAITRGSVRRWSTRGKWCRTDRARLGLGVAAGYRGTLPPARWPPSIRWVRPSSTERTADMFRPPVRRRRRRAVIERMVALNWRRPRARRDRDAVGAQRAPREGQAGRYRAG